jgi:hypothetical protein
MPGNSLLDNFKETEISPTPVDGEMARLWI